MLSCKKKKRFRRSSANFFGSKTPNTDTDVDPCPENMATNHILIGKNWTKCDWIYFRFGNMRKQSALFSLFAINPLFNVATGSHGGTWRTYSISCSSSTISVPFPSLKQTRRQMRCSTRLTHTCPHSSRQLAVSLNFHGNGWAGDGQLWSNRRKLCYVITCVTWRAGDTVVVFFGLVPLNFRKRAERLIRQIIYKDFVNKSYKSNRKWLCLCLPELIRPFRSLLRSQLWTRIQRIPLNSAQTCDFDHKRKSSI